MKAPPSNAHPLLDTIRSEYGLKSDSQLARLLGISVPDISKIRHGRIVSAEKKIIIMRRLAWSLSKLDKIMPPVDE